MKLAQLSIVELKELEAGMEELKETIKYGLFSHSVFLCTQIKYESSLSPKLKELMRYEVEKTLKGCHIMNQLLPSKFKKGRYSLFILEGNKLRIKFLEKLLNQVNKRLILINQPKA